MAALNWGFDNEKHHILNKWLKSQLRKELYMKSITEYFRLPKVFWLFSLSFCTSLFCCGNDVYVILNLQMIMRYVWKFTAVVWKYMIKSFAMTKLSAYHFIISLWQTNMISLIIIATHQCRANIMKAIDRLKDFVKNLWACHWNLRLNHACHLW